MFSSYDSGFWKTVVETMQEGLMLIDPKGKIMYINKAFEDMIGYTNDELVDQSCEVFQCDRCYSARANGGVSRYCALFKEEKVRNTKCTFKKKKGGNLHLLKNANVIRDEKGKVVGGVETLIDLSKIQEKEKIIANLRQKLNRHESFDSIVGKSPAMQRVLDLAMSAAQSDAPLIIYGESGTGKEILANAIHSASQRGKNSFIKVNCAALNDNLLESELFGHVKGAFTGADYNRVGRFEAAIGGSIFLDEIGDLPMSTQTKLLRVLQEKEIERVGDHRPIDIDVRFIAATHKDLQQLLSEGLFREDLYYRIGVIPIYLPPLRERTEDIPQLVETFIKKISDRTLKPINSISRGALNFLMNYSWPGNIRELINAIEYAFVLCPGNQIQSSDLPGHIRGTSGIFSAGESALENGSADKRQQLVDALVQAGGNQTKAARILGVSRVTVWKWIKKHGIRLDAKVHSD